MLNVGIIGLGRWGQVLVRSIQEDGKAKGNFLHFVACHTRSPDKVRAFIGQQRLRNFDSYDELIRSKIVDAVVIATPHSDHVAQICMAAEAGLHVFVEKPLALTAEGSVAAIEAARNAGTVLAVGFNRRFLPSYVHLSKLMRDGILGHILHLEGNFSGPFGLSYTHEVWHANQKETPAGGMTLMGIHVLDAMIGMVGAISGVRARSRRQFLQVDIDDTTDATLEFQAGPTGYLSTMTATPRCWRLQVFGTDGWAKMDGRDDLVICRMGHEPEVIEFPTIDIERAELEAFSSSVVDHSAYPVRNQEVLNGVSTLEAIYASAKEGRFIAVG